MKSGGKVFFIYQRTVWHDVIITYSKLNGHISVSVLSLFTSSCIIQSSHTAGQLAHSALLYLTQVHWHSGYDLHKLQSRERNTRISNKTSQNSEKLDQFQDIRSSVSPRFGVLAVCLPPRSLKKPRPKEERAFLVPKLSSLVAFALVGGEEPDPALFLACEEKIQDSRKVRIQPKINQWSKKK